MTTATPASSSTARTGLARRTKGMMIAATIATLLTACGPSGQSAEDAAPATVAPAAPTTNEAPDTASTATPDTAPAAEAPDASPSASSPKPAAKPIAAPAPKNTACSSDQLPDGLEYEVANISATASDGGLVVRTGAGYDHSRVGTLLMGTLVGSYSSTQDCQVTPDGAVWWHVSTYEFGQGWVNAKYLEIPVDWMHGDTGYYFDIATEEVQAHCVYLGFPDACAELEMRGFYADSNYGLGNSLTMAPDADLWVACDLYLSVECYELDARGFEFPIDSDADIMFNGGE